MWQQTPVRNGPIRAPPPPRYRRALLPRPSLGSSRVWPLRIPVRSIFRYSLNSVVAAGRKRSVVTVCTTGRDEISETQNKHRTCRRDTARKRVHDRVCFRSVCNRSSAPTRLCLGAKVFRRRPVPPTSPPVRAVTARLRA